MLNLRPWNKRSLRAKLSILAGTVAALVVAGFGVGVSWHLEVEMYEHFDGELLRATQAILETWEREPQAAKLGGNMAVVPLFYVQLEQPEGHVIYRSKTEDAPPLPTDPAAALAETPFGDLELRWAVQRKGDLVARVAVNHYIVDETVGDVILVFLGATPVALVVAVIGANWLIGRVFRPFEDITAAVEHITAENLGGRLPVSAVDDELGRLTRVLNSTFDRLESAFQQSARFAADASHELRTPLTLLRAELDRAMGMPDLSGHCQEMLSRLQELASDLSGITEALLLLSRADAGKLLCAPVPVDLCALLVELKEDLSAMAVSKDLSVEVDLTPGSWVLGDVALLRHLIYNLFENAVKYNDQNGSVRVVLEPDGSVYHLSVGNTGAGIPPDKAAMVFDRFFRTDPSRGQIKSHGLGLSLSREIARAHHGDIVLHFARPGWTEFWVTLPAIAAPS